MWGIMIRSCQEGSSLTKCIFQWSEHCKSEKFSANHKEDEGWSKLELLLNKRYMLITVITIVIFISFVMIIIIVIIINIIKTWMK